MSDVVTDKAPHHLGMPGINSPGYAPRQGTPEYEESAKWTKEYWDRLWAGHLKHEAAKSE